VIDATAGGDRSLRSLEELRMDERQSDLEDNAAIRDVIESWAAAVRRRDIGGILQNHSSDIIMFDATVSIQGNRRLHEDVGLVLFLVKRSGRPRFY